MSIDLERLRVELQNTNEINLQLEALGMPNTQTNRNWVVQALLQDPNNPIWIESSKSALATLTLVQVVTTLLGQDATPDVVEDIVYYGNRTYPVGTHALLETNPSLYQLVESLDMGIRESDPLTLPSNLSINHHPLEWLINDLEMKVQQRIADIFGGPLMFNEYSYHIFVHQALLEILQELSQNIDLQPLLLANYASSIDDLMQKYADPLLWVTLVYPFEIQEQIQPYEWLSRWFEYNPVQLI